MKKVEDDELSMNKIEDYNNNESKSKRNTVRLVVLIGLLIGVIYTAVKYNYNEVDDYIGTKDNPGIDTTKR